MTTKKEYLFMPSGLYEAVRWLFAITPYVGTAVVAILAAVGLNSLVPPVAGVFTALETFFTSLHMVAKKTTDKRNK